MRFLVYFVVLLITGSSVLFGLDWLSSPMSPMPPIKPVVQVAKAPPVVAPVPAPVPRLAAPQVVVAPATPAPTQQAAVSNAAVPSIAVEPPRDAVPTIVAPVVEAPLKCDVNACTAAYRSFTASDCTYQPSFGPRRLCAKGVVPIADAPDPTVSANARAQCNVTACAAAYGSFNAADCTYQPFDGPRRLCEK